MNSHITQDALENVLSQLRKSFGRKPNAIQSLSGVTLFTIFQFISDKKSTNYCSDSDKFLADFLRNLKQPQNVSNTNTFHF